jgi:RNA ligase (TIGR02306 family)
MVGSRNWPLKEDPNNVYWKAVSKFPQIFEYLPDGCILYGEVYGKGIQKLNYNKEDYTIAFFDLSCSGVYLNNYCFKSFCKNLSLPHVPILYSGPWRKELLSLAIGKSTIATHIKEGIVIKPSFERYDKKIGRVVLKHLSEEYLMKDYGNLH